MRTRLVPEMTAGEGTTQALSGAQRGAVWKSVRLRICADIRRKKSVKNNLFFRRLQILRKFCTFSNNFARFCTRVARFCASVARFCVIFARCCANCTKTYKIYTKTNKTCAKTRKTCANTRKYAKNHGFRRIFTPDFENVPIFIPPTFVLL